MIALRRPRLLPLLRRAAALVACAALARSAAGCTTDPRVELAGQGGRGDDGGPALVKRRGLAVADGCVLDAFQQATLADPATRRILDEVTLLCLVPGESGAVGPSDASARAELGALVGELRRLGYVARLGVAFTDGTGTRYPGDQIAAALARPGFAESVASSLASFDADAFDLDLQGLPASARPDVARLVGAASARLGRARVGLFVPPSLSDPSDLPGGDAFDLRALTADAARVSVMTLDFSETEPGPTLDSGWAVEALRFAAARATASELFVSLPLYGVDFGPRGRRGVSALEAEALATRANAAPTRLLEGALRFDHVTPEGERHVVVYEDLFSTAFVLGAFAPPVLPASTGVLFYGLGAEEPGLFGRLARRTP